MEIPLHLFPAMSAQPPSESPVKFDPSSSTNAEWLDALRQQVSSLRFGVIQIVVHEGRVVQIERTEKFRVTPKSPSNP
jgi:hypothetical protein